MELQIFTNEQFGQVRTAEIDGQPWLVGKDVAEILGYERPTKAIQDRVDDEDKYLLDSKTQSQIGIELGQRGGWLINESGLYSLILSSKLPQAKQFKRWVTSEVLPAIRKNGAYVTDYKAVELVSNPNALGDFLQGLTDQVKALETRLEQQKPQVIFAQAVSASQTSILIGDFAKILRQNGKEIGQNRLFGWLREHGFLINRKGNSWNMPTQRSMDMGLFEIKETTINHSDGHITISKTPKMTGKGQVYFMNRLLGV